MTARTRYLSTTAVVAAIAGGSLAGPALGATTTAAQARKPSVADTQWLQGSIEGDRFEIQSGHLAEQRGSTPEVRGYGTRLVTDHTKSLREAITLARSLHIQVPVAPSPQEQGILELLGGYSGTTFDTQFVNYEAKDHQQDISEATDERDMGVNRRIRNEAVKEIPTLQAHLKIAEGLGGKIGTNPTP